MWNKTGFTNNHTWCDSGSWAGPGVGFWSLWFFSNSGCSLILYNVVFEGTWTECEPSTLKIPQSQLDTALRNQVLSQSQFSHFIDWQVCSLFLLPLSPQPCSRVDFNKAGNILYYSRTCRRHAVKNFRGISQYIHSFYRWILHLNVQLNKI